MNIVWHEPQWRSDKASWFHYAALVRNGKTYERFNLTDSKDITPGLKADANRYFHGVVSMLTMRLA